MILEQFVYVQEAFVFYVLTVVNILMAYRTVSSPILKHEHLKMCSNLRVQRE